ncbi:MAG: DUF2975 domain-containing protein [Planctomycetia bacterium]|nr:DUF2975 domain-containing protein [Planctomycetia bacterium]
MAKIVEALFDLKLISRESLDQMKTVRDALKRGPLQLIFTKEEKLSSSLRNSRESRSPMKRSAIIFLQIVIVLIGLAALALLLWEPQIEGRNKDASQFEIYFQDPFLVLVYAGSIPFFVALYQAIRALGYIGRDQVFSQEVVKALRIIKYCALAIIGFVVVEEIWILLASGEDNDNPGAPIFLGLLIVLPSIVVAVAAAMFERISQNGVDLKSENELTV